MKKSILMIITIGLLIMACSKQNNQNTVNPFLVEWETPFGTPPFSKIETKHYLPAFEEGIKQQKAEIDVITSSTETPTFENTIEAMEYSGALLTKVTRIFYSMTESMTSDDMQEISKKVSPMRSKHQDDINLNATLFQKVKTVYNNKENLSLTKEQQMLLEKFYKQFVRGGANLASEDQTKFRKINEELSLLSLQFGENVLKDINTFEMVLDNKDDLAGLPQGVIDAATEAAKEKGYKGKWLFNITKPSMIPFLQYAENRTLREKLYKGYINKGSNNNELDNKKILSKIVSLRIQKANLLGYKTHADFVLDAQMAKTPDNVFDLLNKLWTPALNVAKKERADMQKIIDAEGGNFKLASWDWWYYSEKVKKQKYNLDEEELRPYFKVENVIKGVFDLASTLWDIKFIERTDIEKYHPDVKTFEVQDLEGNHIGILYTDYFPRASKRGGAWMDAFRKQSKKDGKFVHPIIYNVGNFSKPTAGKPSLLSVDEVNTLFHEFGHAIHGMLSNCTYESLSGTETPRDFVEFPSQVMENWCMHPDVLKNYAIHYETGEIIPTELVEKLKNSSKFNQGFATVEYLAAAYLDMKWHTLTDTTELDADKFEKEVEAELGLIPEIIFRYRSTYFNHIFSGGYSSGYYSYVWAEVLDADAFAAFVESGDVYNKELATKYRTYILSSGGTDDSMELYKKFRGKEPSIEPLIERRGLN